jgi:hypothetical protein
MARAQQTDSARDGSGPVAWLHKAGEAVAERRALIGGIALRILATMAPLAGLVAGLWAAHGYVQHHPGRGHVSVSARLCDTPGWMPASLARDIRSDVLPHEGDLRDPELTRQIHRRANANPWVREVRGIRKLRTDDPARGVAEIDAIYRSPAARVLTPDGRSWQYVSHDAHRLPDDVPRWRASVPRSGGGTREAYFMDRAELPAGARVVRVHYVFIRGVEAESPAPGEPWPGDDVEAGLRLVKLLWKRPYAAQIVEVDVRNIGWRATRAAPQIRMVAVDDWGRRTEIVFGRFPHPDGDWVVPTECKLAKLDAYAARHGGRLAGFHAQVDLTRHDQTVVKRYGPDDRRRHAALRARMRRDDRLSRSHGSRPR